MKLAIIFPTMERGGAEEYALTMARAAVARGWQVSVASPAAEATCALVQELQEAGASWRHVAIGRAATIFGRRPKFLVPWIEAFHAFRLLRDIRPDAALVVMPGPGACHGVLLAAALLHLPTAACLQLTPRMPFRLAPLWRRLMQWSLTRAQQWISISDDNKQYVETSFGFPTELIKVIYNGAPQIEQIPQYTRDELCAQLNIAADRILVLTIARLGVQKAHAVLLDALPSILEQHPRVHLVWLGDGPLRAELEELIALKGLSGHVSLAGYSPHTHSWLHACDLFALPTHYEGLPFSLVEAMAAGKPVLASAVNSIPFVLQHGDAGLLVPDNTAEVWAGAIAHLLSHPAEMQSFGAKAKARAGAFSQDTMVNETLTLLTELPEGKVR